MYSSEVLKNLVKKQVDDDTFEELWRRTLDNYERWKSSAIGHNTSDLSARLEFLKTICAAFPKAQLYKDKGIADLVLSGSGARDVGYAFKCRLPNGRTEMATIVNREISNGFGILYTLETAEGFRFTHEFFD